MTMTWTRTLTATPGKGFDALAWAGQIDAIASRHYGKPVKHAMSVGGQAGRIWWCLAYESFEQFQQTMGKLSQDPDYQALVSKAEGLIVPGSIQDDFWVTN